MVSTEGLRPASRRDARAPTPPYPRGRGSTPAARLAAAATCGEDAGDRTQGDPGIVERRLARRQPL